MCRGRNQRSTVLAKPFQQIIFDVFEYPCIFDMVEFWSMFSPLGYFKIRYIQLAHSLWSVAAGVNRDSLVFLYWTCDQGTNCKCEEIVNIVMNFPTHLIYFPFYSIFAERFLPSFPRPTIWLLLRWKCELTWFSASTGAWMLFPAHATYLESVILRVG